MDKSPFEKATDAAKNAPIKVDKEVLRKHIAGETPELMLEDLHKEDGLFNKTHAKIGQRDKLGEFDEYVEKLEGGRYGDKLAEVKDLTKELEELKDAKNRFELTGRASKEAERDIARLERQVAAKAKTGLAGVEKISQANQKVMGEAQKEYFALQRDVRQMVTKEKAVAKTQYGINSEDYKNAVEEIEARAGDVKAALETAHEERMSHCGELDEAVKSITKDVEQATGKSVEEILGKAAKGSHVEKLSKEGSEAAKEGNALIRFAKGNPIKTAIGAAVVGALGMAMLRGGNRQEGAAR